MTQIQAKHTSIWTVASLATLIALISGCGGREIGAGAASGVSATSTLSSPASISLSAAPSQVTNDGISTVTISATVLDASNAAISTQPVTFSSSGGQLSSSSATTDSTGKATITFSAGSTFINRTETITATAGAISKQLPIQAIGSTLTSNPISGIIVPDNGTSPATITFTALNAAGIAVPSTPITLSKTGVGNISFTPASGSTDINGKFAVTVTGNAGGSGSASLVASALGTTASAGITVQAASASFGITGLNLNATALTSTATNSFSATSMKTGDSLVVTVTAPAPTTQVTFASSMGTWNGGVSSSITVPVVANSASATLTTTSAGIANVQVVDASPTNPSVSDSLTVAMTAVTPFSITLQASPSLVQKSVGTTAGVSTLTATVVDANNLPVGGALVAFSILNPTGGGESVSPVLAYTTSTQTANLGLGQASATFTAGSKSSGQAGIQIHAEVLGIAGVATETNTPTPANLTVSGNDAAVVIGGSAGSVAFGQATALAVNTNATNYILAMSVMVADSNGNPAPIGTPVNLSLWPIAWSTGGACAIDADSATTGTFYNEDVNENLILDVGEDGTRKFYASGLSAGGAGTQDALITPSNSVAGTVPGTVLTDANGVATFNLEYPKTSGLWTVVRLRGRTVVQGSDAVGEVQFRLDALQTDVQPCRLPDSPFRF